MRSKRLSVSSLFLLAFCIACLACAGRQSPTATPTAMEPTGPPTGTWVLVDGDNRNSQVTFADDGRFIASSPDGVIGLYGSWKEVGQNKIEASVPGMGSIQMTYLVAGDSLIITTKSETAKYRRKKPD
jgi:hypothetical protein